MNDDVIPDPTDPTHRAISAEGELLSGLFWVPKLPDEPTIADLDGGIHVGWVRPDFFLSDGDDEWTHPATGHGADCGCPGCNRDY